MLGFQPRDLLVGVRNQVVVAAIQVFGDGGDVEQPDRGPGSRRQITDERQHCLGRGRAIERNENALGHTPLP